MFKDGATYNTNDSPLPPVAMELEYEMGGPIHKSKGGDNHYFLSEAMYHRLLLTIGNYSLIIAELLAAKAAFLAHNLNKVL